MSRAGHPNWFGGHAAVIAKAARSIEFPIFYTRILEYFSIVRPRFQGHYLGHDIFFLIIRKFW